MFLAVLIGSLIIVALAFLGLGLNIFFRKNGKFPDHEVGTNENMKKMGLTCAKEDESPTGHSPSRDCGLGCSCVAEET